MSPAGLLDATPGRRPLADPDDFYRVHGTDGGLGLPGMVLIRVRTLESGANALSIADVVATRNG
ncbi:hypothetical protein HFP89_05240 [Wenzhouxiangella sp. XN79A]|uniref:hypothetical protein n=1 Tax=Wenzhouxiangella sp. XN79A TaxID=2724193 RepID=UPI00144A7EE7|nr:hypothetical protein [Wenzhouxiangella sp. XN79A]NKI34566.1 hypothetical protein [Wenzhouxiangella sp. XN79A]